MSSAQGAERTAWWRELGQLLRGGWRIIRLGGWRLASLYLAGQVLVGVILAPVLHWLFVEALRAAGLVGLDGAGVATLVQTPSSMGMILGIIVIAFLAMSAQLLIMMIAVIRVRAGLPLFRSDALAQVGSMLRRLARPSSAALLPYLFLLLPLSGLGFLSVLSQGIAIPSFVSGELVKSVPGLIGYIVFLLVLLVLNDRLALALPLFAMTDATGGRALRRSWTLMRRGATAFQLSILVVFIAAMLSGAALLAFTLAPVALADAVAPTAAPVVAAIMLAFAQVAGMLIMGAGVTLVVAIAVEVTSRLVPQVVEPAESGRSVARRLTPRRATPVIPIIVMSALIVGLAAANAPAMQALAKAPETLVLGHRGYTAEAVENTISSLRTARDAEVDFVEVDVMETADERFVIMHDANLGRLAGLDDTVGELTLDELTAIEVHDLHGRSDRIPSLADYIRVAQEIDQPLLIEMKLHGGEREDVVERLVAELEELDALDENIYHSLDQGRIEELKRLRPALSVGLTMAIAGIEAPATTADFVVIEEWSLTPELRRSAERAGLGVMAWTVNDEQRIRDLLRDDIDGIITDNADNAVSSRESMRSSRGVSDVLFDAIMRFVVIF